MMAFGGIMIGRNDLPHIFQMSGSLKAAAHVGRMVTRYARDRLTHSRGTRLVNGNALIARMAAAAIASGIPLWLSSPIVELHQAGVIDKEGKPVEVTARLGVVLARGGFPGNDDLTRRLYAHWRAGKNHATLPRAAMPAKACGSPNPSAAGSMMPWTSRRHGRRCRWCRNPTGALYRFRFYERGKPGYISVDRRGRRFANESKSYHVYVPELIEACRDDATSEAWIVCDHRAIRRFGLGALGPGADADAGVSHLGLHQARRQPARASACLRHRRRGARPDAARFQCLGAPRRRSAIPTRLRRLPALQRRRRPVSQFLHRTA